MPVLLSDEELNALSGITDIQYRLYISGIRRYMDYKTGITGIKRKISYQSLSEEIYVDPRQGNKNGGARSKDQVKRALKALETAGLITVHSIVTKTKKQLILKCILAITDDSAQNKPALLPPHSAAPQAAPVENKENPVKIDASGFVLQQSRPTSRPLEIEKAAAHPISGKDTILNYTKLPDFLSTEENKFLNLFTDLKLSVNLAGDLKAITTAKALVQAGVTLEVAAEALNVKLAAYKGDRAPHPSYFKDAIINYKKELDIIKNQPQEIATDGKLQQPSKQNRKRNWETLHEQGLRELAESKVRTKPT